MDHLENTELVLAVAERRRKGRPPRARSSRPLKDERMLLTKRACLALYLGNMLLYVVTFGLLAALPWAAMAFLIGRAPSA